MKVASGSVWVRPSMLPAKSALTVGWNSSSDEPQAAPEGPAQLLPASTGQRVLGLHEVAHLLLDLLGVLARFHPANRLLDALAELRSDEVEVALDVARR